MGNVMSVMLAAGAISFLANAEQATAAKRAEPRANNIEDSQKAHLAAVLRSKYSGKFEGQYPFDYSKTHVEPPLYVSGKPVVKTSL